MNIRLHEDIVARRLKHKRTLGTELLLPEDDERVIQHLAYAAQQSYKPSEKDTHYYN